MLTISTTRPLGTAVTIYTVAPAQQAALVTALAVAWQAAAWAAAGLVGAALFRSPDGERVAVYAQWQAEAAYHRFAQTPAGQALHAAEAGASAADAHWYRVALTAPQAETRVVAEPPSVFVLAQFFLAPENQPALVKMEKQAARRALAATDELLSVNFHYSLDGTRTLNLSQFRSLAGLEKLAAQPGFAPASSYWRGMAENDYHRYELAGLWLGSSSSNTEQ
jgi:heme-degrading monooxygenase HmoA